MLCAPAIGIDLGTTYSCVGVFRNGTVEIIANDQGSRTTPSYVAFSDTERFIGEAAKGQEATNASNTVFDAKRLIGRRFQEESVQSDMKRWPFEVVQQEGKPRIRVEYKGERKTFYPEEISAMVLAEMKQVAENYLGQTVTKAVVTVPAYFNDSQRQATKDAATIAGLDVLRIINEPTSAAMAYGLVKKNVRLFFQKRSLLVFDLGGGTLDVSVVTIKQGALDVLATAGNTHLGGEDFNNRMVDHFVQEFKRKHKKDLTASKRGLSLLRAACENAKKALSMKTQANIDIPCLFESVDFHSTITRMRFDALNDDLFRNTLDPIENALNDAKMKKEEVDDIVLVGGSTRIPKIQLLLRNFFDGKEPSKDINPDEAVAYGAAVRAAILNGDQFDLVRALRLQDVAPLSLGIEIYGHAMTVVINRNTAIPTRWTKEYTTSCDNQTAIRIKVYEGERPLTKNNNLLGKFRLNGIEIAPEGVPVTDVTFDIDCDGILKVSAVDRSTGSKNQLTITNDKGRLSVEEIRRMVSDAEKFKEEDEKQRIRIAAKMALEKCAFSIRSTVEGYKGKIFQYCSKTVLNKVNATLEWLDSNRVAEKEEFTAKQKELKRICCPIIAKLRSEWPTLEDVD